MARPLLLLASCFFLLSCGEKAEEISPDKLPLYGVGPQSHTFYTGSDKKFHYFSWTYGDNSGIYKVSGADLKLDNPFPKGSDRAFIHKNSDGKIRVGMSPYNPHTKSQPVEE